MQPGRTAIFYVIKTIRGRQYLYAQTSVRQGKRVRSICRSLGRYTRTIGYMYGSKEADQEYAREMGRVDREQKQFEDWQRKTFGETGVDRAQREAREREERIYTDIRLPVPGKPPPPPAVDKPAAETPLTPQAPEEEAPSTTPPADGETSSEK